MALDEQLRRQIVRAVLAVAGIAAVIGLVVALTATAALRMAGVSGDDGPAPSVAAPDPDQEPTPETVPETPESSGPSAPSSSPSPSSTPSSTPSPSKSPSPKPKPSPKGIQLQASALAAAPMEQVTLSGSYPGGNGTTLQVQRREGGTWAPFPTSASVDDGSFNTYVALGQPGPNRMRMLDTASGKTSNVVVVTIS